jgi:hypothetical protein
MTTCSEVFRASAEQGCSANQAVPNPLVIQNGGTPPVGRHTFR